MAWQYFEFGGPEECRIQGAFRVRPRILAWMAINMTLKYPPSNEGCHILITKPHFSNPLSHLLIQRRPIATEHLTFLTKITMET